MTFGKNLRKEKDGGKNAALHEARQRLSDGVIRTG
jgi:hypothetical protein